VARPKATHATLGGIAARRAKLAFTLAAGSKSAPLKKIAVHLPHGLGFTRSPKAFRAGVSVRAGTERAPRFTAAVGRTLVTITLRKPAAVVAVSIRRPALVVGKALARKVGRGKVKKLKVVVRATDVGGRTTVSTLRLRPR
jgi:hypothetical protein